MDNPMMDDGYHLGRHGRIHVTGTASEDADFDKRVHVLLLSPDHFGNAEVHEFAAVPLQRKEGLKPSPWACFFRPPHHGRRFSLITALAVDDEATPFERLKAETDQYIHVRKPEVSPKPAHGAGVHIEIDGAENPREVPYGDQVEVRGPCRALGAYGEGILGSSLIFPRLFWFELDGTCHREPPPPQPPPAPEPVDPLTLPAFAPFPPEIPDPDRPGDGVWKFSFRLPVVEGRDPLVTLFCATLRTLDRTHRSVSAVVGLQFTKKKGTRSKKHQQV
jgi:hypothetical protein